MTLTEQTSAITSEFLSKMSSPAPEDQARVRELLHEDFTWSIPQSFAEIFDLPGGLAHGYEGLCDMTINVGQAVYSSVDPDGMKFHFSITDGNVTVMEYESAATTYDGTPYRNLYCQVIEVRDGKIWQVREHNDSLYSFRSWCGTPEKLSALKERLKCIRAGKAL